MAKYESRYKELTFYVEGERKQFVNGVFSTEDKATMSVLDSLRDVTKTEIKSVVKPKASEPKAEERKPADKPNTAPKKAKPSDK